MNRLALPRHNSSLKSPVSSPLCPLSGRERRALALQKISSLPIFKSDDSGDTGDFDTTNNVPNGFAPHGDSDGHSPSRVTSPMQDKSSANDEFKSRPNSRRSASVKIKFNDETVPSRYGVINELQHKEPLWESQKEADGDSSGTHHEGSPLLDKCRSGVFTNDKLCTDKLRRGSGETRV